MLHGHRIRLGGALLAAALTLSLASLAGAAGTVSLTILNTAYTQDFNTLASSGTSGALPTGWYFLETGTNANLLYTAGTGSSNAGDTYSFGATGNTERALGGVQSGSLVPTFGASFTNNTGSTIGQLAIAYTGEEWRLGTLSRPDQINFEMSTDATSLNTGTWSPVAALNFVTPDQAGVVGAKNGNAAGDRTAISNTIINLAIPNGTTFWIRWTDFNALSADDGLAVDDFSLTPAGQPLSSAQAPTWGKVKRMYR